MPAGEGPWTPWAGRARGAARASADRPSLVQSFDKAELLECIRRLVEVDKDWVPDSPGASLYLRPLFLGNEVGPPLSAGRTRG